MDLKVKVLSNVLDNIVAYPMLTKGIGCVAYSFLKIFLEFFLYLNKKRSFKKIAGECSYRS